MRQRILGNTGVSVSELGLGTAFMRRKQNQDAVTATIARAVECGVCYFDTAADYGHGDDERALGEALIGRREQVFLATKVGGVRQPGGAPQRRRPDATARGRITAAAD